MAFVPIPSIVQDLGQAMNNLAEKVKVITDGWSPAPQGQPPGIFPLRFIDELQSALEQASAPATALEGVITQIVERAHPNAPDFSDIEQQFRLHLFERTIPEFGAGLADLRVKATAWNAFIAPIVARAEPPHGIAPVERQTRYGDMITTSHRQIPTYLSEADGVLIQTSQEAADLRAALVALTVIED